MPILDSGRGPDWILICQFLLISISWTIVDCNPSSAVLSRPEVECGADSVSVHLELLPQFRGRLFVLGHSHQERCQHHPESGHSTEFSLPFGACGMRRIRSLHPRGVTYSFTLVVSAHPVFVTGADRAFAVKCFFREDVRDIHRKLEVGALSAEDLAEEFEPPRCTYELRSESGEELQFARVGQPVVHTWSCHPDVPSIFGLLIHSCMVEDGGGEHFELIDSNGCPTDPLLLPPIDYHLHALQARVHSRIFKFADKVQVYFRCSVQLCFRHDGGCEGVTPPSCHGGPEHGPHLDLGIPIPPSIKSGYAGQPPHFVILNPGTKSVESYEGSPENSQGSREINGEHAAAKGNTILKGKPILVANNIEALPKNSSSGETTKDQSHTSSVTTRTRPLDLSRSPITHKTSTAFTMISKPKIYSTTPIPSETTRHVRALQSELSVDLLVLPFEKSLGSNETAMESHGSSPMDLCLSRISALALGTSMLLLFFIGCGLGHLMTRQCTSIRPRKPMARESTYKAFDQ